MLTKIKKCIVFLLILTTLVSFHSLSAPGAAAKTEVQYANFRNVRAGKIGRNILYRSQHPANGSYRSQFANKLAKQKGVRTVINLCDTKGAVEGYFRKYKISPNYYYRTLYAKGRIHYANIKEYHNGSAYRKKVAYACRFMNVHQGPYLIHCKVGRDRTGFMILLLECLMDAPFSYMLRDYEQSLINVNGYNWEKAHKTAREKLRDELHYMTGKSRYTNWNNIKLRTYAEKYLKKCGLSAREILRLKKNLSKSYTKK